MIFQAKNSKHSLALLQCDDFLLFFVIYYGFKQKKIWLIEEMAFYTPWNTLIRSHCLVKNNTGKVTLSARLLARQPSCVYIWLTYHGGIPGLEDRLCFSVIRFSLCWDLSGLLYSTESRMMLWECSGRRVGFYTGLVLMDTWTAGFQAACLVLAGCVWSMFTESHVLTLPIFAFLLCEESWLRFFFLRGISFRPSFQFESSWSKTLSLLSAV